MKTSNEFSFFWVSNCDNFSELSEGMLNEDNRIRGDCRFMGGGRGGRRNNRTVRNE